MYHRKGVRLPGLLFYLHILPRISLILQSNSLYRSMEYNIAWESHADGGDVDRILMRDEPTGDGY